jgi:hypothetical protein
MEVRIHTYPMVVCNDLKKKGNKVLRVKTRNKVFPCLSNKEQRFPLCDKRGTRFSLVVKGVIYFTSSAPGCIIYLSNETVEIIPVLVFLLAVEENNNY